MGFVIVLAILTLVVMFVSAPLRRPGQNPAQEGEEGVRFPALGWGSAPITV